ncbi:MAG: hypothetical protein HY040_10875 [Planctomycetes bacterium]|nr:hypothetical protein [Planctomycetota bacterium]
MAKSRISCPNGHVLGIGPQHEGKKIRCPKCQVILQVPMGSAVKPASQAPSTGAAPSQKPAASQGAAVSQGPARPPASGQTAPRPARPPAPPPPPPLPPATPFSEMETLSLPARKPLLDDDDDLPRSRRPRDEGDDERPRRRRDDEFDERPRARKQRQDDYVDEDDDRRHGRRDDDEDEDEERRRSRRGRDDEWDEGEEDADWDEPPATKGSGKRRRATRTGLQLHFVRYGLMAGAFAFILLGFALIFLGGTTRVAGLVGAGGMVILVGAVLGVLAAPILGLIGNVFCMRMEPRAGGSGLALGGLILDSCVLAGIVLIVVFVGASFGSIGMEMNRAGPPPPDMAAGAAGSLLVALLLYIIVALCALASFILFMLMLRNIARFVGEKRKAGSAVRMLIVTLAVGIGGGMLMGAVSQLIARMGGAGAILFLVIYLAWVISMIFIYVRVALLTKAVKTCV